MSVTYKWVTEIAGQTVELNLDVEHIVQDKQAQEEQMRLLIDFIKPKEEEKGASAAGV